MSLIDACYRQFAQPLAFGVEWAERIMQKIDHACSGK
jgi:hypothetical protein